MRAVIRQATGYIACSALVDFIVGSAANNPHVLAFHSAMTCKTFLFVFAMAICFAIGSSALKQDHDHDTYGRLLMSHESDSTLTIFDLDTESLVNTLEASATKANVYPTEDGLFGIVVTISTGESRKSYSLLELTLRMH